MNTVAHPENLIYGLYCTCHPEEGIRYVGLTSKSLRVRLSNHKAQAKRGAKSPLYSWVRKHSRENIVGVVLEVVPSGEDLGIREVKWIQKYRGTNHLVNLLEGGYTGFAGVKRPEHSILMSGEGNPMYGLDRSIEMAYARSFQGPPSQETKALWSENRKGEKNGRAKLKEEAVLTIRGRFTGERGQLSSLAREYGVSVTQIQWIVQRKSWKHLP